MKNKVLLSCLLFLVLLFSSCNTSFNFDFYPDCSFAGWLTQSDIPQEDGSYVTVSINVKNNGNKSIEEICFWGNIFKGSDNAKKFETPFVLKIDQCIKPGESQHSCFSLDEVLTGNALDKRTLGNLYISKIIYSDGTQWNKPFDFAGGLLK